MSVLWNLLNQVQKRGLISRGVKSLTAQVRGTEVHYYLAEFGAKGPPLVLLHGLGADAHNFTFTIAPFAKHFSRVYALSLPGCGFSPLPMSGPLDVYAHFDVLRRFINEVVGEKVVLLGNSLGGALSLFQLLAHPDSLHAAVLVAPAGAPATSGEMHVVLEAFAARSDEQVRAFLHKVFAQPKPVMLRFPGVTRAMLSTPAVKHLAKTIKLSDMLKEGELASLRVPTLLVWGGQEKLLPKSAPEFFRRNLPPEFGRVDVVEGYGHLPQLEFPRDLIARVVNFAAEKKLLET